MESRCSARCCSWGRWEVVASRAPSGTSLRIGSPPRTHPARFVFSFFKINNNNNNNDRREIFFDPSLGELPFLLDKCVFYHFFPHTDERLRQHGVAAASSSPGRTDDSALLGHLRIRSGDQLTYYHTPRQCMSQVHIMNLIY